MSCKSSEDEWLRGLQESAAGIELLRSLWPKAFPQQAHFVRPLVSGLAGQIAERMGWSPRYAAGVLRGWKLRRAYCQAVLHYDAAGISKVRKSPPPLSKMQHGGWPANNWPG